MTDKPVTEMSEDEIDAWLDELARRAAVREERQRREAEAERKTQEATR